MKLVVITFKTAPNIPGVRAADLATIRLNNPGSQLLGWKVLLRGPSLFFVSPPGWKAPGRHTEGTDLQTIHEVPRINTFLYWEGTADEIANVTKYDSPPFGPEPEPVVAPVVAPVVEAKPSKKMPGLDTGTALDAPKTPGGLLAQVPGILT